MHESFSDGVLGNARRLRTDAAILFDKGRFPSCVLLLLFCLEELGKAFLISLGSLPAKQLHRNKQVAGLCLAMGSGMIRVYDSQLGDWRTALGEENYGEEFEEKFETILQSIEDKDTIIALWKPYQVLGMSKEGVLEKNPANGSVFRCR